MDRFSTSNEQIRLVGERWAVESGMFLSVLRSRSSNGVPMSHHGQYTILWRRTDAGRWRIDRYIEQS